MALHIQTYLRNGGTLADLVARYGITAKRHREYPNLVQFKYDQIGSPMGEPIVRECRGIILDEAADWRVIARGFDKFSNHGEGHADPIDWATARVQTKEDGSLLLAYHYAGRWHVATTGTPDASGNVHGNDTSGWWEPRPGCRLPMPATFADLFWQTFAFYANDYSRVSAPVDEDYSFMWELTTPLNRVVVPHTEARITLLGARNRETGQEVTAVQANRLMGYGFHVVREFDLNSIDEIVATFGAMSPLEQEGYVVLDRNFRRVKVKHPGYVSLHHAKDGMSVRAFVEIARAGEMPEVVTAFPELRPMLDEARGRFDALVSEVQETYEDHAHRESQKDFALAIKSCRCAAACFAVRAGKVTTVREFLAKMPIDSLLRLLGYKT